jgi:uncharacterized protein
MNDRDNPLVKCPQCRQPGRWFGAAWGPFCSERCRLLDLGRWFGEEHRLTRPLTPGDFEGFDELESGPHLDRPEAG